MIKMAISMQINGGFYSKFPIINKSSFKSMSCHMKTMESGKTNFYHALSLESSNVTLDQIKKAYRYKALEYHPDVCHGQSKEESTKRFLEIKLAFETLSDPIARVNYDHELSLSESAGRRNGSWCMESNRGGAGFSKAVWESQLHGLKERSKYKLEKRRNQCVKF